MITFKALGNTYKYPEGLQDISLKKFIEYCEFEKKNRPEKLQELSKLRAELLDIPETDKLDRKPVESKIESLVEEINNPGYIETMISWNAKVIEFWTGLPYATIVGEDGGEGMNLKQMEILADHLLNLVGKLPEVEYTNVIEYMGELWYLGERYMKDSTVIPYLEASQLYKIEEALAGGQWGALAKAICILLRRKGEKYNKKLLEREKFFLQMPMDKALQVAFFFERRTRLYSKLLSTYIASQTNVKLKQALTK